MPNGPQVQANSTAAAGDLVDRVQIVDSAGALVASESEIVTTLTNGRKTVTAAGTAEAIRATLACKWVVVTALPTNTSQVNVGASGVLAASGTQTGVALNPGDAVTLPVADAATVFVDSRVNAEGVEFVVGS